ncbi:e3 ubiquitin protein ligase siah1 [Echinococcus multilocularis]|uniref:E3 ubiquitin-protein ligase n=1 Tax=Echinococcus multilocularis TaxID=6211 RepID=A0A068YCX0_ECHMU|nr:e3 ubiquitin protein ligase siah1 [Echinococcus multilocularis]
MSSSFSHAGSDRPTSVVVAEPSARPTSHRQVSSTVVERHFAGVSSSNPQRPAASAALFDFDSAGADGDSSGSRGSGSGGGGAGVVGGVSRPTSASVTPITATPVLPNGPERPPPTGAGGNPPTPTNSMDLVSLFECPVCMDFALPPILQCQSGHIVCASCRSKLSSCPTCRGNLENIRNLAMEKLAASILFPCKYALTGCAETFHYTVKAEHESVCEHRPYSCPCPGTSCKWLGQLDQVMPHLLQSHKSITTLQGEDIVFLATDITLPGAVDWVMMQSCFGHYFMLVLEKQERVSPDQFFFALVLLIGTKKQADQFVYKLDLTASTRRLTWEATPRSIHDGVQTAIANSDCLVFDSNMAQLFADNGSLGINVTISRARVNGSSGGTSASGTGSASGGSAPTWG